MVVILLKNLNQKEENALRQEKVRL
jgi:hypothetical protein